MLKAYSSERAYFTNLEFYMSIKHVGLYCHYTPLGYRLYTVVPRSVRFIDQLTNWYVRFNRRRIKVCYWSHSNMSLSVLS